MTWHNTKEIGWHTIEEIEWHSIQEITWHKTEEIRHDQAFSFHKLYSQAQIIARDAVIEIRKLEEKRRRTW